MSAAAPKPKGVLLIAVFFALSICVLVSVGTALWLPGSFMEVVWKLYPARRAEMMPYRALMVPGFFALATAMLFTSIGLLRFRRWGWWLAVTLFVTNGLIDFSQIFMGRVLEGAIGVPVACAIIYYLTWPSIRSSFT